MSVKGGVMVVTQTPRKPHLAPSPARLVVGWVVVVIAVFFTVFTGYSIYDYATSEYIGPDAAVRMFILLVAGVLALLAWSGGLLLVVGDRIRSRRWFRIAVRVVVGIAVLGALVLLFLAVG